MTSFSPEFNKRFIWKVSFLLCFNGSEILRRDLYLLILSVYNAYA